MSIPVEFTPEHVAEHSPQDEQLYIGLLRSGQPYRSLFRDDFHTSARHGYAHDPNEVGPHGPTPGLDLNDDDLYYNTAGAAADYWKSFDLPTPTKDLRRLRADMREWGYCLISEGLSDAQCAAMKKRVEEQAEAERLAGIASWMGSDAIPGERIPNIQFVHCLINKGLQFLQCVEHDPEGVQAAALIEQLLNETVGRDFLMSSFIAIITNRHNMPQDLHQDQSMAPFQESEGPFSCNTMFVTEDLNERNGGTLVVPGSHRFLSAVASGQPLAKPLPPALNLEAPAGTVMVFEGRLLHGTGVNKTDESRTILVMNAIKPFMRQQEQHLFSTRAEILADASPKLLYRLGARPIGLGGFEGAWTGDYLVNQRLAIENGSYLRIGELSPDDPADALGQPFGYRSSEVGQRQAPQQPETLPEIRETFADLEPAWQRTRRGRFPR